LDLDWSAFADFALIQNPRGEDSDLLASPAVPMIGGMISSTILTLIVIPAVYAVIKGWGLARSSVPGLRQATENADP
jgi:hypothetical protein